MRAPADREEHRRQREGAARKAGRDDVAAGRAHLVGLPQRQNAGRIRSGFDLRRRLIGARGFEHEVGAGAAEQPARIAPARPQPIVRALRELAHPLDELVAFDVGVEHVRGADLHRHARVARERDRWR